MHDSVKFVAALIGTGPELVQTGTEGLYGEITEELATKGTNVINNASDATSA